MSNCPENLELPATTSIVQSKNKGSHERSSSSDDVTTPLGWCFVNGLSRGRGEKKRNQAIVRAHTSRRQWAKALTKDTIDRNRSITGQVEGGQNEHTPTSEKPEEWPHNLVSRPYKQRCHDIASPTSFTVCGTITSFDPFETYPSDVPRKLVDRLMPTIFSQTNRLLPPLGFEGDTERWGVFTRAWIQASVHDRALFHAALYASLFNSRTVAANPTQSREELLYYHIAVREINHNLNELELAIPEDIIQSVCCLSFHEDIRRNTPSKTPRQGPFRTLQLLDLYGGTVSPSGLHSRATLMMVCAIGGPGQLKFSGLPQLVCYLDIMCGNRVPRRPVLEFISRLNSPSDELHQAAASHLSLLPLGTGFSSLDNILTLECSTPLKLVLHQMCEYTIVLDSVAVASHLPISFGILADMRNFVQHNLLSLCSQQGMDNPQTSPLLDACQAAAMIYSWIVIFPAPVHAIPFHDAAAQIKSFSDIDEIWEYWRQAPDLVLWILVMGALASYGSISERGYISLLLRAAEGLNINSWRGLKGRLEKFLWYPAASDVDGQDLWQEILQARLLL